MVISILTLFPEVFSDIFSSSIIGRAQKKKLVEIRLVNIRDFATDKHKSVDDKPYGGGVGMVMRVDVVERAIESAKCKVQSAKLKEKVVLLDPTAPLFTQAKARKYSKLNHLILVCGHYEGIDGRIYNFIDESVSIGQYILTGGEIPAMVIVDAIVRLIPKVLSKEEATKEESYSVGQILEAPQYTRPPVYKGLKVPEILLSGNHKKIADWKKEQAVRRS